MITITMEQMMLSSHLSHQHENQVPMWLAKCNHLYLGLFVHQLITGTKSGTTQTVCPSLK